MKSPMHLWANEIRKRLRATGVPITPDTIMAGMVNEDSPEVKDFFFYRIPPKRIEEALKVQDRLEIIRRVAREITVN